MGDWFQKPLQIPKSKDAQVFTRNVGTSSVYFKSSQDYLYYLIQCKCYGNSCQYNINAMEVVAGAWQIQVLLWNVLEKFFLNISYPQMWNLLMWKADCTWSELLFMIEIGIAEFLLCPYMWLTGSSK